jgi:hypothetical protein
MSASDAWECRYITTQLPARFLPNALSAVWESDGRGEIREEDVYLLAAPELNIKLRRRTNTLKVKIMKERRDSGLEFWRTEIDAVLPAGRDAWQSVLHLLKCRGDAARLGEATDPNIALTTLKGSLSASRVVPVSKTRWKFYQPMSVLEIARFQMRDRGFASVAVEACDSSALETALLSLGTSELGRPRNYVELLRGEPLLPASPRRDRRGQTH